MTDIQSCSIKLNNFLCVWDNFIVVYTHDEHNFLFLVFGCHGNHFDNSYRILQKITIFPYTCKMQRTTSWQHKWYRKYDDNECIQNQCYNFESTFFSDVWKEFYTFLALILIFSATKLKTHVVSKL